MTQYPSKMEFSKKQLSRFWAKVEKTDSCWLWTGAKFSDGYGAILSEGKVAKVHRLAWEEWNHEPIPFGMVIMHMCNQKDCCNPEHLELGTYSDNLKDCILTGLRSQKGESNGRSILNPVSVREIRRSADSQTLESLAKRFGVSDVQIGRVVRRECWQSVR